MDIMDGKRKNIKHFDEMSNKAFIQFMDDVVLYEGAIPLKVNMKLDGFLASFGMDEDNRIWLQTGKSGKIYDGQDFIIYTRKKHKEKYGEEYDKILKRASCYKRLLEHIQQYCVDLKPGDFVTCEVFDKNQATWTFGTSKGTYQFVNLEYDSKCFPETYTMYVYSTNTLLIGKKYFNLEIRNPNIWNGFVRFSDSVLATWNAFEKTLKKSKLDKAHAWIIKNLKADIAKEISNHPMIKLESMKLGASEGIVIWSTPGTPYKIINPTFREMVKKS